MKKRATSFLIAMCGGILNAQPTVDIGLFPGNVDTVLEVRVCSEQDFGGVVSAMSFTIQWMAVDSQYLGARVLTCPSGLPISATATDSGDVYMQKTYNGFGTSLLDDEGCPWTACTEHVIMYLPVGYAVDPSAFELASGLFFVSLNGQQAIGSIYTVPCLSTAMNSAPIKDRRELLTLFPNPATDLLNISWPHGLPLLTTLDLIAVDGRIVRSPIGSNGTVDIRSLPPGLYAIRGHGFTAWFLKH